MKKTKTVYVCDACAANRCAGQVNAPTAAPGIPSPRPRPCRAQSLPSGSGWGPTLLESLDKVGDQGTPRFPTGMDELDRVLGAVWYPGP